MSLMIRLLDLHYENEANKKALAATIRERNDLRHNINIQADAISQLANDLKPLHDLLIRPLQLYNSSVQSAKHMGLRYVRDVDPDSPYATPYDDD